MFSYEDYEGNQILVAVLPNGKAIGVSSVLMDRIFVFQLHQKGMVTEYNFDHAEKMHRKVRYCKVCAHEEVTIIVEDLNKMGYNV